MARIDLWAFLHLNQNSLRNAEREAVGRFEKMGDASGAAMSKGIEKAAPKMRRAIETVTNATVAQERANRALSLSHADVTAKATEVEKAETKLGDAKKANTDLTEKLRQAETNLGSGRSSLGGTTGDLTDQERDLLRLRDDVEKSTRALEKAEQDASKARRDSVRVNEDQIRRNEDLERSNRRLEESHRRLAETERSNDRSRSRSGGGGGNTIGSMMTDIPGVPGGKAGAVIGTGVITVLASVAEAAVTASQALALIPAGAAAAGAGFLTLAVGTHGFDKALKEMGDPKKFAEALQSLSPAAQQAALEIKALVDGPLGELKKATQEALFKGVPEQIHNAANVFTPMVRGMTTGLAGSFNNMFSNLMGQLETPKSLSTINDIIGSIVKSFQLLEPAVAPFANAILKITQTGSSFLPQLAQGITDAANSFNNFITRVQTSGQLHDFIQKGIDAAKMLGDMLFSLGQKIYETFGNKSPAEFKQTLDDTVNTVMAVAQAVVGIADGINRLLSLAQPFADALGGWPTLAEAALGVFVGAKMIGALSNLGKMTGLIGTEMSVAAGTGAGAITTLFGAAGPVVAALTAVTLLADALGPKLADALSKLTGEFTPKIDTSDMDRKLADIKGRMASGDVPGVKVDPVTGEPFSISRDTFGPTGSPSVLGDLFGLQPGSDTGAVGHSIDPGTPPTLGLGDWFPKAVPGVPPKGGEKGLLDQLKSKMDPNQYMPNVGAPPDVSKIGQPQAQWGNGGEPFAKNGYGYYDIDPRKVTEAYQNVVRQARDVRDAQMDVAALQQSGVATQLDILKAKEKAQEQEEQLDKARLDYSEAQQGKWKKISEDMSGLGDLGLDRDLGISKGIGGFVENLVKAAGSILIAPLKAMAGPIDKNSGSGLIGMLLGRNAPQAGVSAQGVNAWTGTQARPPVAGALPGESARDFAHRVMMPFFQSEGLTVGDHAADKYGEHQNGALDIMVKDLAQGQSVLQQVLADPNVYGAIFNNKTYGYGHGLTPQDYGSTGSPTDKHEDHVHAWYKPGGKDNIVPGPLGNAPGSSGAVPVTIVNASSILGGLNWDALAQKESSGNWQANTGNGYYGGLQFDQKTWDAYKGAAGVNASRPDLAPRDQQIAVGQQAYNARGGGQSLWPQNYQQLQTPSGFTGGMPQSPRSGSAYDPNHPTGGGNFNPGIQIDTSNASVAPPYNPNAAGPELLGRGLSWGDGWVPGQGVPGQNPLNVAAGNRAIGAGDTARPDYLAGFFGAGGAPQAPAPGAPVGPPGGVGTGTLGQSLSAPYAPTTPGSKPQGGWKPDSKGGVGIGGGALGMAMQAGSAMAGPLGPVASMGMQMATQLASRTLQFGSQAAGIAAQGLMDTFATISDPDGGSGPNLGDSLPGRLLKGLAGAGADIGAGAISAGSADKQADKKKDPNAQQKDQLGNAGQKAGQGLHIENMTVQADRQTGQKVANDLGYAAANAQWGR